MNFLIKDTGILGEYKIITGGINNPSQHEQMRSKIIEAIMKNILTIEPRYFLLKIKELHSGKEVTCNYTIQVNDDREDLRILQELKQWRGDEDDFEAHSMSDEFESDGVVWFLEGHCQITKEEYDILNKFNI